MNLSNILKVNILDNINILSDIYSKTSRNDIKNTIIFNDLEIIKIREESISKILKIENVNSKLRVVMLKNNSSKYIRKHFKHYFKLYDDSGEKYKKYLVNYEPKIRRIINLIDYTSINLAGTFHTSKITFKVCFKDDYISYIHDFEEDRMYINTSFYDGYYYDDFIESFEHIVNENLDLISVMTILRIFIDLFNMTDLIRKSSVELNIEYGAFEIDFDEDYSE